MAHGTRGAEFSLNMPLLIHNNQRLMLQFIRLHFCIHSSNHLEGDDDSCVENHVFGKNQVDDEIGGLICQQCDCQWFIDSFGTAA